MRETGDFAAAYAPWVLAAIVVFLVCRYVAPQLTRRTRLPYDDLIVAVLTWAVPLVILLIGFLENIEHLDWNSQDQKLAQKTAYFVLVSIGIWFTWRIIRQIVENFSETRAAETETPVDDILVPMVRRAAPLLLVIINLLVLVRIYFGADGLDRFLAVVGGLSFLLIFLFRDPLQNLFGGIYLLLDTPFRYGDLVILENEKAYRIDNIGTRVTLLYDVKQHTSAYVPNNTLANQRITNITRPNTELRTRIDVGVGYDSDLTTVEDVLTRVAHANPNILGPLDAKLEAIAERREKAESPEVARQFDLEIERLRREQELRDGAEAISRMIWLTASYLRRAEAGGLSPRERAETSRMLDRIEERIDGLRDHLTVWLAYVTVLERFQDQPPKDEAEVAAIAERLGSLQVSAELPAGETDDGPWQVIRIASLHDPEEEYRIGGIVRSLPPVLPTPTGKPSIEPDRMQGAAAAWIGECRSSLMFDSQMSFYADWARTVRRQRDSLAACRAVLGRRWHHSEFTLDDRLMKLREQFNEHFMLALGSQQEPQVNFVSLGASAINAELEFYVDNLRAELFERVDRVVSETYQAAVEALTAEGIELPFQQVDLHVKDVPPAPPSSGIAKHGREPSTG